MATSWTVFWKSLGISTPKRNRAIKNYNVKNDYATLHRTGVERDVAESVYKKSSTYRDRLFFNHLSRFFRQDPDTVKKWLNATSKSEAFERLYNQIDANNIGWSKEKLSEIDLILKFYKKGEGRQYEASYKVSRPIDFDPKSLIFNFNRIDQNAKYNHYGTTKLGTDFVYCIRKVSSQNLQVYKFIKLSPQGSKLIIALSMDSSKEYTAAKKAIERWLNLYIDTPEVSKPLVKFQRFLSTGESQNFTLTGVTYFDNNFKFTVSDIHNRPVNVGQSQIYRRKITAAPKKIEAVSLVRIFHKAKAFARPVPIRILSYKTGGIIGAISFIPNDRNLNDTRRKKLKSDFQKDFGVPLNEFITYKDVHELDIYRLLLEEIPQKEEQIDLRSPLALSIYQNLVTDNLFKSVTTAEEQARICVNPNCPDRYKTLWNKKFCTNCGQALINGKKLITRTIEEWSVVNFIHSYYNIGTVTKLSNKLLKRSLSVAKIENGENTAEFIPLNSELKDHQMQVLKFRYPNLVIVTSQDNLESYRDQGLHAIRLYELVYNCKKGRSTFITQTLEQSSILHLKHTRTLCGESVARIADNKFYKDQNRISKYLGAEMFEADCSTLLDYVFGNSLWLGAKYRGRSLPDGFTAFPLLGNKNGCFIWDTKYGEGKKVNMGKSDKNIAYIEAAKKNKSIITNGGLKGFVFISNNKFPKLFEKKYLRLVKGTRMKLTFLTAEQLKRIVDQYRKYEKQLTNNDQAKLVFMQSMQEVFFNHKSNRKVQIIEDQFLDPLLQQNEIAIKRLKAGKALTQA